MRANFSALVLGAILGVTTARAASLTWNEPGEWVQYDDKIGGAYLEGSGQLGRGCELTLREQTVSGNFKLPVLITRPEGVETATYRCADGERGSTEIHYRWLNESPLFRVTIRDSNHRSVEYNSTKIARSEWLAVEFKTEGHRGEVSAVSGWRHGAVGGAGYLISGRYSLFPFLAWQPGWQINEKLFVVGQARLSGAVFQGDGVHPILGASAGVAYLPGARFDVSLSGGVEHWFGANFTGPALRVQAGKILPLPWWAIERVFLGYGLFLPSAGTYQTVELGLQFFI